MIIALHSSDVSVDGSLLDQMFKLRAKSFAERRKWRVSVSSGMEVDVFDDLDPLYIMSVSQEGQLLASLRLLQTTGPHMLSDVFPETMSGAPLIRNPLVWESSRFCVDTQAVKAQTGAGTNRVTAEILLGMLQTANQNGIQHVVSVYDTLVERILKRVGCQFDRLGEPFAYDGLETVAGVCATGKVVTDLIRRKSQLRHNVFEKFIESSGKTTAPVA